MSDYMPDPRSRPDKYGTHDRFDYTYEPASSRSSLALVGVLAALGLIGGLLFFGSGNRAGDQQALEPPAAATQTTPATPATPAPATRE
jgi:hypothetical protein